MFKDNKWVPGKVDIGGKIFPFPPKSTTGDGIQFSDNETAFNFALQIIAAMADHKLGERDTDPLWSHILRVFEI